jgi:hypothetical protein
MKIFCTEYLFCKKIKDEQKDENFDQFGGARICAKYKKKRENNDCAPLWFEAKKQRQEEQF